MEHSYEERVVAFLDILGFEEHIKRSINDSNHLSKIFFAVHWLKEQQNVNGNDHIKELGRSITYFSDSLVVSYSTKNMQQILPDIMRIQLSLASFGLLLRGGIDIGMLYHHQDSIVFGPAMISAYKLESAVAKYPRIVISEQYYARIINISTSDNVDFLQEVLMKDADGFYYLNFLFPDTFYPDSIQMINSAINHLEKEIKYCLDNYKIPDVRSKAYWMQSYIKQAKEKYKL